ncbi:hypothetical protein IAQ61_007928 [Plenodomus lingam]|uniref:uncharacterized protein n=1 Tax=Leptosphaeria maculans TaxID=5022 RepID=UPI003318DCCE|nr:hypothetical protein IAQ61_007928 [Plenodomus lingam]
MQQQTGEKVAGAFLRPREAEDAKGQASAAIIPLRGEEREREQDEGGQPHARLAGMAMVELAIGPRRKPSRLCTRRLAE